MSDEIKPLGVIRKSSAAQIVIFKDSGGREGHVTVLLEPKGCYFISIGKLIPIVGGSLWISRDQLVALIPLLQNALTTGRLE